MSKEPYVKPEVNSEVLEPEALVYCNGSPNNTDRKYCWIQGWYKPSCGFCCDE